MQGPAIGVTAKSTTRGSWDVLTGEAPLWGFRKPEPWHRSASTTRRHWVYVVALSATVQPVKVGITNSLQERVWALSAGSPGGVELLDSFETTHWLARQIESRMHKAMADRALGREWFDVPAAFAQELLCQLGLWAELAEPHIAA